MKRRANILITVTALIVLTFCGGGISLSRCDCSGKISLMLPGDKDCCPTEGSCMSVTTLQVSDCNLTASVDLSHVPAVLTFVAEPPTWVYPITNTTKNSHHRTDIAPPGVVQSMVMRV